MQSRHAAVLDWNAAAFPVGVPSPEPLDSSSPFLASGNPAATNVGQHVPYRAEHPVDRRLGCLDVELPRSLIVGIIESPLVGVRTGMETAASARRGRPRSGPRPPVRARCSSRRTRARRARQRRRCLSLRYPDVVGHARAVVGSREVGWQDAGDLIVPLESGLVGSDVIDAESGKIVNGDAPRRRILRLQVCQVGQKRCPGWRNRQAHPRRCRILFATARK